MKILVVGSGGREHAITWRLAQDAARHELFCAPGNAGMAAIATCVALKATDVAGIVSWCEANKPDLVVVGPEAPLCAGLVDALEKVGVRAFGPVAAGARMEGSKRFAKDVMQAAGVPTGRAEVFTDAAAAKAALPAYGLPVVIKADGLAAGKGVIVAETTAQAEAAIDDMLVANKFGAAGAEVLIEEFLDGEECSILALVDGENAVLLPSSQDHKRVFDGDKGQRFSVALSHQAGNGVIKMMAKDGAQVVGSYAIQYNLLPADFIVAGSTSGRFAIQVNSLSQSKSEIFLGDAPFFVNSRTMKPHVEFKAAKPSAEVVVDNLIIGRACEDRVISKVPYSVNPQIEFDPVKAGWKKVFDEEFDGDSLDMSKWFHAYSSKPAASPTFR